MGLGSDMGQDVMDVATGCMRVAVRPTVLRSTPLGSCVAVVTLDPLHHVGGMAHVMVPGRAPADCPAEYRLRYACDAIDALAAVMIEHGADPVEVRVAIVGAANVLQCPEDEICAANIESAERCLARYALDIVARDVGGTRRRSAILDISDGSIWTVRADDSPRCLWATRAARQAAVRRPGRTGTGKTRLGSV